MRRTTGLTLLAAIVLLAATGSVGMAARSSQLHRPRPLQLRFKLIAHGWLTGTSDDRYVLVSPSLQTPTEPEVIDDVTGQVLSIPTPLPWCGPLGLSGTSVVFTCGSRWQPNVRAYSFTAHAPEPLPQFNSGCQDQDPTCGAEPMAVGADWIEYETTPCYHCGGAGGPAFQNLRTGQLFRGEVSGNGLVDLSVARLIRKLCAPLFVPKVGSVVTAGRFALIEQPGKAQLERCGRAKPLRTIRGDVTAAATRRAIVYQQGSSRTLRGIGLPSLKRFSIRVPKRLFARVPAIGALALIDRTLYIETVNEAVPSAAIWAARLPGL